MQALLFVHCFSWGYAFFEGFFRGFFLFCCTVSPFSYPIHLVHSTHYHPCTKDRCFTFDGTQLLFFSSLSPTILLIHKLLSEMQSSVHTTSTLIAGAADKTANSHQFTSTKQRARQTNTQISGHETGPGGAHFFIVAARVFALVLRTTRKHQCPRPGWCTFPAHPTSICVFIFYFIPVLLSHRVVDSQGLLTQITCRAVKMIKAVGTKRNCPRAGVFISFFTTGFYDGFAYINAIHGPYLSTMRCAWWCCTGHHHNYASPEKAGHGMVYRPLSVCSWLAGSPVGHSEFLIGIGNGFEGKERRSRWWPEEMVGEDDFPWVK